MPFSSGMGVAKNDAMRWIPENHGVEKSFGIAVGELQLPVLARIGGVVDAGLVAGPGRHQESFVGVEGDYGAEVQRGGAGDLGGNPGFTAIHGAQISTVCAAGPGDFSRDGAHPAQTLGGVGDLDLETLRNRGSGDQ